MYCKPDHYKITVEDTLELLYVRAKTDYEKEYFKENGVKPDEKIAEK